MTGAPIKVREQRESRPGDYAEVYADVTKIREELGWTARYTDLEESRPRLGVAKGAQNGH